MRMRVIEKMFGRRSMVNGLDSVADILSNCRRRETIRVLEEGGEPMELSELTEVLARNESESEHVESSERKRVYIALHQCHLPRMDDHNVVEYNSSRKTIATDEAFSDMKRALEKLESLYR